MGSKCMALLLCINILLFSIVSSSQVSPISPEPQPLRPKKCPKDALKLGVCADILTLVRGVVIGAPPTLPCCALLAGLVNLEAAVCLCTAIRANLLGIKLNIPVTLSLVLNNCGKQVPNGYECP